MHLYIRKGFCKKGIISALHIFIEKGQFGIRICLKMFRIVKSVVLNEQNVSDIYISYPSSKSVAGPKRS